MRTRTQTLLSTHTQCTTPGFNNNAANWRHSECGELQKYSFLSKLYCFRIISQHNGINEQRNPPNTRNGLFFHNVVSKVVERRLSAIAVAWKLVQEYYHYSAVSLSTSIETHFNKRTRNRFYCGNKLRKFKQTPWADSANAQGPTGFTFLFLWFDISSGNCVA